jgi:hypothetical protein
MATAGKYPNPFRPVLQFFPSLATKHTSSDCSFIIIFVKINLAKNLKGNFPPNKYHKISQETS